MTVLRVSLALAAALTFSGHSVEAACRQAGGSAQMPTRAVAEFMAEAALKNAIAAHSWKVAGPISMKCKDDTFTCTARRRACD